MGINYIYIHTKSMRFQKWKKHSKDTIASCPHGMPLHEHSGAWQIALGGIKEAEASIWDGPSILTWGTRGLLESSGNDLGMQSSAES